MASQHRQLRIGWLSPSLSLSLWTKKMTNSQLADGLWLRSFRDKLSPVTLPEKSREVDGGRKQHPTDDRWMFPCWRWYHSYTCTCVCSRVQHAVLSQAWHLAHVLFVSLSWAPFDQTAYIMYWHSTSACYSWLFCTLNIRLLNEKLGVLWCSVQTYIILPCIYSHSNSFPSFSPTIPHPNFPIFSCWHATL